MIFYSPYIGAEMLRSYKWMGMGMGLGWVGYLCGVLIINTNDKPAGSGGKGVM